MAPQPWCCASWLCHVVLLVVLFLWFIILLVGDGILGWRASREGGKYILEKEING
jgi:hypothetical protein